MTDKKQHHGAYDVHRVHLFSPKGPEEIYSAIHATDWRTVSILKLQTKAGQLRTLETYWKAKSAVANIELGHYKSIMPEHLKCEDDSRYRYLRATVDNCAIQAQQYSQVALEVERFIERSGVGARSKRYDDPG